MRRLHPRPVGGGEGGEGEASTPAYNADAARGPPKSQHTHGCGENSGSLPKDLPFLPVSQDLQW